MVGFFCLFSHILCFCFIISKSPFELQVTHSDTVNVASVVLFCGVISFYKFWQSYIFILSSWYLNKADSLASPAMTYFQYHLATQCHAWRLCTLVFKSGYFIVSGTDFLPSSLLSQENNKTSVLELKRSICMDLVTFTQISS